MTSNTTQEMFDDEMDGLVDDVLEQQQQQYNNNDTPATNILIKAVVVTPGEMIVENAEGVLRGHGTYVLEGKLFSSVCGVVERVNKLITVRPLRARYMGEVGDVVVGRITDIKVGGKRWKVDIQGRQDATLLLSSVNLPGNVQRRKTYEDQLNMRNLFMENDVIAAEVQQFFGDGTVSLQTRSARYGKLENGLFVRVYAALVKRCKRHFYTYPFGVQVILGNNGYIWITMASDEEKKKEQTPFMSNQKSTGYKQVTGKDRDNICRVRNCILALQKQFLPIYPETIYDVYESSLNIPAKNILSQDMIPLITVTAYERVKKLAEEQQKN